jgi:hypothetical protein
MSDFESSPAMVVKRALFDAGLELAGVRLQLFAERLLQAADDAPGASLDALVRTALREIDGGALAVIVDEPQLHDRPLSRHAKTVTEAAELVLHSVGVAILEAHGTGRRASGRRWHATS